MRTQVEKQPTKKMQNVSSYEFFEFFMTKLFYKKDECSKKTFIENLALIIIKSDLPIHFWESLWLKLFCFAIESSHYFFLKKQFHNRFCQTWFKKQKMFMFYQNFFNVCYLLQVSICGCQKARMTFLLWSLTFSMKIGNPRR